jgi:DNA-binding response OmpR family regulator
MSAISNGSGDVIVVDASLDDYSLLVADDQLSPFAFRHFSTGEAALRGADLSWAALWLVNLKLADMEGVALLGLLRHRSRNSPLFLISNAYSADEEVAARAAGASAYLWKPADAAWLRLCRQAVSRAAVRKGMPHTLP